MQKQIASQQVTAEIAPVEEGDHLDADHAPPEAGNVQANPDTKRLPTFRDLFSLW